MLGVGKDFPNLRNDRFNSQILSHSMEVFVQEAQVLRSAGFEITERSRAGVSGRRAE